LSKTRPERYRPEEGALEEKKLYLLASKTQEKECGERFDDLFGRERSRGTRKSD